MNIFNQIASGARDLILQQALNYFLSAQKIIEVETKTTVRLDAEQHLLYLHLQLKGESTPTELTISYRITQEDEIEILGIESTKEWIKNAVGYLISQGSIKIRPEELLPETLSHISSAAFLGFLR